MQLLATGQTPHVRSLFRIAVLHYTGENQGVAVCLFYTNTNVSWQGEAESQNTLVLVYDIGRYSYLLKEG
jgi:hypothetical protein